MPMKVRYETINGEVMSETRGGVHKQYIPDPLGSTVALMDDTQTITDTFSYWPYGGVASRTGTTQTPLQYVGTAGYYSGGSSLAYVRRRYLDYANAIWLTQDPIGFASGDTNFFRYVANNPETYLDPSGLFTNAECKAACDVAFKKSKDINACYKICTSLQGATCGDLGSRCKHMGRHREDMLLCQILAKTLCPPPPPPPSRAVPDPAILPGVVVCGGIIIVSLLCALDPPCWAAVLALAASGGLKIVTQ